jgi:hypothetical protein
MPVWDLLSSLAVIDLKGKLGTASGIYGCREGDCGT